jgi:hypothetical protein
VVVVAAAAVLIVPRVTGDSGWTGVVIDVPICSAQLEGCRAYVIPAAEMGMAAPAAVAHADWSGSATALDLSMPAGSYAVALEGCTGDKTPYLAFTVTSGTHPSVDDGQGYWETPMFLGRTCPGFHGAAGAPPNS